MEVICKGCEFKCSVGYNAGELEYHHWARSDSYGIYTGLYCDKCYNSERYPYRKDRYFNEDYIGESLYEEDYN